MGSQYAHIMPTHCSQFHEATSTQARIVCDNAGYTNCVSPSSVHVAVKLQTTPLYKEQKCAHAYKRRVTATDPQCNGLGWHGGEIGARFPVT